MRARAASETRAVGLAWFRKLRKRQERMRRADPRSAGGGWVTHGPECAYSRSSESGRQGVASDVQQVHFGDWPGRIFAGIAATSRLAEVMEDCGARRAMVICGATVERTAMLGKVEAGLGT